MTADPEQNAAARLLAALTQPDPIDHAAAHALIPELVEAERAGADVDDDPRFAALLIHLSQCETCLDLYERTAEALEAFLDTPEPPTIETPEPFTLLRRNAYAALRSLRGAIRRFELSLTMPALQPVAVGSSTTLTLFDEQLHELSGAPELAVMLIRTEAMPMLRIRLHEASPTDWQVHLLLDDARFLAIPGPDGIAELRGFTEEALRSARAIDLLIGPATQA